MWYYNSEEGTGKDMMNMKTLTLILALTLPIIFGLDLTFSTIAIAVALWIIEVIKWMNDNIA